MQMQDWFLWRWLQLHRYPSIFVLLLVDFRQISIALKTCECVSLSLFLWLMYKNLVLSPGLTVKSLSRNTSLKRRPIELIPAGGKDWHWDSICLVMFRYSKKNQYGSTWKHNYDKSTELKGWHYCKKVSTVFYSVLYALMHNFQCFSCRVLFGLWKWVTRIQREDRSVRIVSGARGVGEVGGMKTSAPGFCGQFLWWLCLFPFWPFFQKNSFCVQI